VVKEEVRVRKDVVEDTEVVEEDVRREEVDVETRPAVVTARLRFRSHRIGLTERTGEPRRVGEAGPVSARGLPRGVRSGACRRHGEDSITGESGKEAFEASCVLSR
jgi:hypothetical protein